jgi:TRAP-type C4-dicarboxylate transport system substrate-binding protein
MLPDLASLPPEVQQQIQQIEQQLQQQVAQLQQTVTVEAVEQLLKSEKTRPFILDVETDSTIEPDQMAEKQARVEFGQAFSQLLTGIVPALQMAPQMAPRRRRRW